MSDDQLVEQLKLHEGTRLRPYRCTAGKLTIGHGRNLEDRGISRAEAEYLLRNDIAQARQELEQIDAYRGLDPVRQAVLIDMAINLGISRLNGFARMWAAIARQDFVRAAAEMLDSRWSHQVGARAWFLADGMLNGHLEEPQA